MARARSIEAGVTIDDVDYTVTATFHAGTRDYFSKSFGNWLPGDPDELEDITVVADATKAEVSFDDFPVKTRRYIEDALMDAADCEARAYAEDYAERRADYAAEKWER